MVPGARVLGTMRQTVGFGLGGSLGCFLLVLLINITIGSLLFNYILDTLVGKTLPWFWAALCGLVAGEITIPVGIVFWILRATGIIHVPLIH